MKGVMEVERLYSEFPVVSKDQHWIEEVYLIDTPGLNAEESDDLEAYNAYRRANMIVFVHTVKAGELKERELNSINIIKNVLGEKYFWSHFCLAMTFLEAKSAPDIEEITKKILTDIAKTCGGKDFPYFFISNSRYKKGSAEMMLEINAERGRLQNEITRKTTALESRQRDFLYKVQSAVDNYRSDRQQLSNMQSRLDSARSELNDLRNKLNRDRAKY